MISTTGFPGIQIDAPGVSPDAHNFRPPSWPPPDNFPVVIDAEGEVISRFSEVQWKIGVWADTSMVLSFTQRRPKIPDIDPVNARLFRLLAGYWIWGSGAARSASALLRRYNIIRFLFRVCSKEGIVASDLYKYPRVIDEVAGQASAGSSSALVSLLNDIWVAREFIGFQILDEAGLILFGSKIAIRESTQTPYIPPRIWTYQVRRIRECLDDYLAHREAVEDCYRFCLEAYAANCGGSLRRAFGGIKDSQMPFKPANLGKRCESGQMFYGAFMHTAERFGILHLLNRWVKGSSQAGIKSLSSYLSLISKVGGLYILNFSLMRADEGGKLRSNCYSVERDSVNEDIHLIGGVTTKTIEDDKAQWIVSPSVKVAIDCMRSVAALRMEAARHDPRANLSASDLDNPNLQPWAYEPWASAVKRAPRKKATTYGSTIKSWPKLFDQEQLRITAADLQVANLMTFGLDPAIFAVGRVWPLAMHQLRRTGAVNMLASGQVSDASLQYQLKHVSRGMSRYYGQNYYQLTSVMDLDAKGFYLREMYHALARDFQVLRSERMVSPHGEKRKAQLLAPITEKDHIVLTREAKEGRISYRPTFLGGCAKPGDPCDLGGITNIVGCMGSGLENACEQAIIDSSKREIIVSLRDFLNGQADRAESDSPRRNSFKSQAEAAERALNVIDRV